MAQQPENKLNQVELMEQFIGSWKCELGKDTILIGDNYSIWNWISL